MPEDKGGLGGGGQQKSCQSKRGGQQKSSMPYFTLHHAPPPAPDKIMTSPSIKKINLKYKVSTSIVFSWNLRSLNRIFH